MAKSPPPGQCVHCLGRFDALTWDHVFPSGWYPETTPANLAKWKIPSCLKCNHEHSKNEGELLIRLGMCIDPDDAMSAGIAEKVLRATRASEGRDQRDADRREATRQKLLSQVLEGENIPRQAIYPGFGPPPGQAVQDQVALPISANGLRRLAEKVVRALIYIADQRVLEAPFTLQTFVLDDAGSKPIREALAKHGTVFERGPAIKVTRAVTPQDGMSGFYEVEIWGRLKMYVSVMDSSRENAT